jgi:hypothetical protein
MNSSARAASMFYVSITVTANGAIAPGGAIQRIEGRAAATELARVDAEFIREKAQQLWPNCEWALDETYRGKYVVRGE